MNDKLKQKIQDYKDKVVNMQQIIEEYEEEFTKILQDKEQL